MKKRILSCLMALALCLTLLPTAALAEETEGTEGTEGTAQTPPAVEESTDPANGEAKQEGQSAEAKQEGQPAEQEEQQEDPAVKQDEAVVNLQAMIDALPDAAELDGMDDAEAMAVYEAFQTACEAYYETLTEEQREQLKNTEKLVALSKWFNEQVAPLADMVEVFPDDVDANGNIIPYTSFSRTGPILTAEMAKQPLSSQFYIVQSDMTINGDLTVDGSQMGGLVLCGGATLTVNGALIHTGGNAFYIYGQTKDGKGTGKLVINNSNGKDAAIRLEGTGYVHLGINSGVVELHGGSAQKLVDGVGLYSTKPIHKGILNGKVVSPSEWGASKIEGTSLVLEYCDHLNPTYTPSGSAKHKKICDQCGFNTSGLSQNLVDCTFDGKGGYDQGDENGHYALCICGNRVGSQTAHENAYVLTDNNTKHVSGCKVCGYTSGEPEEHIYEDGKCKACGYACPHEKVDKDGKCEVCGMTGIVAVLNGKAYTGTDTLEKAVTDWLKDGGTLTLHADGDANAFTAFGTAKTLTIDLNGHRINCDSNDGITTVNLNGVDLTIRDSREKVSSQGVFGPINADSGTLTMESGYLTGLTVPDDSKAKLHLHGGIIGITCSKPVYTLLDDGYALMNGNITVDPTAILNGGTAVYTAKDTKTQLLSKEETASAAIGSNTIPFTLSLKTDDENIGRMGFEWYVVKEDGTTQKIAPSNSNDIEKTPDESGAYRFDKETVDSINWTDLEANKTYDVLCVVNGKERGGAYRWQTPLRGYKLTVTPADLNSGNTEIEVTNANSLVYTGQPLTPDVTVIYNGAELARDKDYTVSYADNTNAGTATVTVTGKDNYEGTKTVNFNIGRATLTVEGSGTASGTYGAKLSELTVSGLTAKMGEQTVDGTWHLTGDAVPNVGDTKTYTATFTPQTDAGNYDPLTKDGIALSITKAAAPTSTEQQTVTVTNNRAHTYEFDLSALLPKLESPREYGNVTYGAPTVNLSSGYYTGGAQVEDGKLILPIQAVAAETTGNIGTVTVQVTSGNIADFPLTINVEATNKTVPTGAPTLSKTTLAWGEQLSTITLSGAMKDGDTEVKGKFEWVAPGAAKEKIGEYEVAWKFTPDENAVYTEAAGTVTITVTKATPKGAPGYTKITTTGKTLKDANLTVGTIQPEGTIQWELGDTTVVTANTAYKWVFTPNDKEHYNELTGSVTPYSVSSNTGGSSSGGGSSSDRDDYDSNPVIKTETKNNPDGSTTKTETHRDGSVTQTTTAKDGSVSKTETKPDGSSVTENKAADGSTGTVKTDKNGQTTAKTALSNKAIEDAKKNGEAVKAPVEVEATKDSSTAPTVKVELPKNSGETKVEIPVSNVKPGTVAVLVHPDGTEEILKDSIPTEDGIQLTVDGGATVKIIDNSKGFIDTRNHWAREEIDFVSARELVNGMTATIYAPNASATRAQLWTILARQNDTDLSGGANWYEKAQLWSKDKGISDGTEPNAAINRAQMVTMLWRTMGQPTATDKVSFADVPAGSYYAQAVAWAVESGITAGIGNGLFGADKICTRAQIATFLARSMK